ncbi:MAG: hypothetical protein GY915_03150, partial [bacterium]|nr:hypothetical protein [bacterium]
PFFLVMTISTALSFPLAFQGQWDEKKAHLACQLNPAYWKGCVNEARAAARHGDIARAKIKLQKILQRTPLNFFALMDISDLALKTGGAEHDWGCHGTWLYDQLFQGQSSLHAPLIQQCSPDLLQSFAKEGFEPRYRHFLYHIGIDRGPFPTLKDFGQKLGF